MHLVISDKRFLDRVEWTDSALAIADPRSVAVSENPFIPDYVAILWIGSGDDLDFRILGVSHSIGGTKHG